MNKNISNQIFTLLMLALMLCPIFEVSAQKNQKNKKDMGVQSVSEGTTKKRAVPEFTMSGVVTSTDGKPVVNALITANEGAIVTRSDDQGRFKVIAKMETAVLIEATGFESQVYDVQREESDLSIVLASAPLYAGKLDVVNLPMDVREKQRYLVGAVSGVEGEALARYPEPLLSNTLQGQIPGLMAQLVVSGFANNPAALYIRGNHRNGGNNIVTIVDGVWRNIDGLLLDEIESVKVMKDPVSKILYGASAANGVLLVTTKRGKMYTRKVTATAEAGVGLPVAYPKWLNSYDYARMYNEARLNDGLPPMYTPADLEGYRNSKGPNDLRYPDVDYYDYFLNKTSGYRKAAIEFSGGNENAQYAFVGGYNGNTGLQKVGPTPTRDLFNVRGNLDMKVTDQLKAFVGMAMLFDVSKGSLYNHAAAFTAFRTNRPNEFPILIDPAYIAPDTLGFPAMGAGILRAENPYERMMYGGKRRDNNVNGQLTLGMNYDASSLVEGLSLKAQLSFDNYFMGIDSLENSAWTWAQRWYFDPALGRDTVQFFQRKRSVPNTQNRLSASYNLRMTSYLFGADFERTFNRNHRISANLFYNYWMLEQTGETPNLQSANTALRANYTFRDKYIAELDLALMGSDRFPKDSRYFMSYAGGLGWIVSEEDFLKKIPMVNYLKVKASAGLLGYDYQMPWNLDHTLWMDNGNLTFRPNVTTPRTVMTHLGNPNLKWETSLEFNLGVEGLLLNRKLWVEINYFNEKRSGIISQPTNLYPAIYGGILEYQNHQKVRNQGIDFEFKYMGKAGDLLYSAGLNGMYSKNKLLQANEVEYPQDYRRRIGKPTDAMFGYVDRGLFRTQSDLDGTPHQTRGPYGLGDIAYKDLNNDNVIDENDQKMVGNSFPRVMLGLNIDLFYKGFGLNLLGVSRLGVYSWLNNEFYWNSAEDKYSDLTLKRFHPINNPDGTYPRLTTTTGSNNFVNSTFWLENSSFFRLKNAEISYTFGYNKPLGSGIKTVKVFTRGTNILTLSKIKDLDPELPNAGVSNYPLLSTFTLGVSVVF